MYWIWFVQVKSVLCTGWVVVDVLTLTHSVGWSQAATAVASTKLLERAEVISKLRKGRVQLVGLTCLVYSRTPTRMRLVTPTGHGDLSHYTLKLGCKLTRGTSKQIVSDLYPSLSSHG